MTAKAYKVREPCEPTHPAVINVDRSAFRSSSRVLSFSLRAYRCAAANCEEVCPIHGNRRAAPCSDNADNPARPPAAKHFPLNALHRWMVRREPPSPPLTRRISFRRLPIRSALLRSFFRTSFSPLFSRRKRASHVQWAFLFVRHANGETAVVGRAMKRDGHLAVVAVRNSKFRVLAAAIASHSRWS